MLLLCILLTPPYANSNLIKAKSLKFLSPQQAAMYYGISPCGTDFAVHDTRQAARNVPANDSNACRMVSITFMSRLRSRTAAKTRVMSQCVMHRPFNDLQPPTIVR